ncbi:MAG: hypothetical protein H0X24_00655 [Ktedonobacterales bacterium]|nr:hypothetical protein [Ktedonobacterales bacterium]
MPKSPHPPLEPEVYRQMRAAAADLADHLGEQESGARYRIWQIMRTMGEEGALALLQEAQEIEAAGGQLIGNGSRRRTFGGIYFHLARERLTRDPAYDWIFAQPQPTKKKPPSDAAAQSAPAPPVPTAPFLWTERQALIDAALQQNGGSTTMKVTLVGRPGAIVEKDQFVMTSMPTQKIPELPRGLPIPEQTQTQVLVYIALKQWRKVAEAIQQPDDVLIIEGFGIYEPAIKGMAVLATTTTTKRLQQAKKLAPPAV